MKPVATFPLEGVQLRDRLLEISQICFVSEDFQTGILIWGPFFHAYLVTYVGMWPGKLVIGRIVLHCSSSIGEESSDNVSNLLLLLTQGISVRFLRVVLVLKSSLPASQVCAECVVDPCPMNLVQYLSHCNFYVSSFSSNTVQRSVINRFGWAIRSLYFFFCDSDNLYMIK